MLALFAIINDNTKIDSLIEIEEVTYERVGHRAKMEMRPPKLRRPRYETSSYKSSPWRTLSNWAWLISPAAKRRCNSSRFILLSTLLSRLTGSLIPRISHKKMSKCTGEEILTELFSHLRFNEDLALILETSNCIPGMLLFNTSQFLVRGKGDRLMVIPKGSTSLAFIGQHCEILDDVVFTVDAIARTNQSDKPYERLLTFG